MRIRRPTSEEKVKHSGIDHRSAFRDVWFCRFDLSPDSWESDLPREVQNRPFACAQNLEMLVRALFQEVAEAACGEKLKLCEAYAWMVFQAWQSGSHFVAYAENYAEFLLAQVRSKRPKANARWIAETICSMHNSAFNPLTLAAPGEIRKAEQMLKSGSFEAFFRGDKKFSEFDVQLEDSSFASEWASLKKHFPAQTKGNVFHRTLVPERNWVKGPGASFGSMTAQFQASLDLLCWKFCLWGIRDDKPILLTPSVTLTPHGTQIFIPAYMSFDLARDLKLGAISKLHRARGVKRQGESLAELRTSRRRDSLRAYRLCEKLRTAGTKGQRLYEILSLEIPRLRNSDERDIRRAIAEGKAIASRIASEK